MEVERDRRLSLFRQSPGSSHALLMHYDFAKFCLDVIWTGYTLVSGIKLQSDMLAAKPAKPRATVSRPNSADRSADDLVELVGDALVDDAVELAGPPVGTVPLVPVALPHLSSVTDNVTSLDSVRSAHCRNHVR